MDIPPSYTPTTGDSGVVVVPSPTTGGGGATTPTAGGTTDTSDVPGTATTYVPGDETTQAGTGNNLSAAPGAATGTLTDGLSLAQIELIKLGVARRCWIELGQAIQELSLSAEAAIQGEKVTIHVLTKDFEPDTPVKLTVFAFHSSGVQKAANIPWKVELGTLDATLNAEGIADCEYEFTHDQDAKIKVRAKVGDREKDSAPLSYTVLEPEEQLGTDEEFEAEVPKELNASDVSAFVGDKIKLLAEFENMPDGTEIKFALYPDGGAASDDAFATVTATCHENQVCADWVVEYHEDATVLCNAGTDFSDVDSENKLMISLEPVDDFATDEEELGEDEDSLVANEEGGGPGAADDLTERSSAGDAGGAEPEASPLQDVDVDDFESADNEAASGDAESQAADAGPPDQTPPPA